MKARFGKCLMLAIFLVCGISAAFSGPDSAVYRIPKVEGITIDGSGSDWGTRGFRVDILADPAGKILPAEDFDVRFRLAWDRQALYVLVIVRDDVGVEHESLSRLWRCDCLEVSVAKCVGSPNNYMVAAAPGADPRYQIPRKSLYDWRPEGERSADLEIEMASQKFDGGYIMEMMLPWENLGIEPSQGTKVGCQVVVNDDDGRGQSFRLAWFPAISPGDSSMMHGLLLSDDASESVLFRVDREIGGTQYAVSIQGSKENIGKEIIARSGDRILAKKRLSGESGRAHAVFSWEENDDSGTWPSVRIEVSGKTLAEYGEIPTLGRILAKYIQAVGGYEPYRGLTSRSCRGRYLISGDKVFSLEAHAVLPDKWSFRIQNANQIEINGYDGSTGWIQNADRIERADHLSRSILGWWLNPQGPVFLDRYFPRLRLIKKDSLEGKTVYVMESESPGGGKRALEFDAGTGLLWRIDKSWTMDDYRRIDGILFPFRVVIGRGRNANIFELTEVKHNGAVEGLMFAMPDAGDVFPDAFLGIDDNRALPMLKMKGLGSRHGEMNIPCRDGRFLYDLIVENGYKRGLEIGTYNGYSTLWLGLAFRKTGGKVYTIEIDPGPAREAQQNFLKAGLSDVIDARINDAFHEIARIDGDFDFIFIDANKEDYGKFLELLKDRLKPGGALIGHNVTNAAEEMRDFLGAIQNDPDLKTTFHPVSTEGISVSVKLPTLEQILERYVEAVGGQEVIRKLTTRVCKGRYIDDRPYAGPKKIIPFETFSKIPDKSLFIMRDPENREKEGFDGNIRWRQDNNGLIRRENRERSLMDYFLDPQNALRIEEYFPEMELRGMMKLRDHEVYVVENSRTSPHYTLYFDVESGILIQIGFYELHEYKEVDGIRFPFRLEYSRKGGSNTYVFEDVQHNIPIWDERFDMPGKESVDLFSSIR
jgi:caffeoyl-CoA O-methyltransferase